MQNLETILNLTYVELTASVVMLSAICVTSMSISSGMSISSISGMSVSGVSTIVTTISISYTGAGDAIFVCGSGSCANMLSYMVDMGLTNTIDVVSMGLIRASENW